MVCGHQFILLLVKILWGKICINIISEESQLFDEQIFLSIEYVVMM